MNEEENDTTNSASDHSQPLSDFLFFDEEDDELFEEYVDDPVIDTKVERQEKKKL